MSKSPVLCIVKIKTPQGERAHIFEKSPIILGRAQEADIVVPHSSASRQHVEVTFSPDGVIVSDKGSTNGTKIDGKKLPPNKAIEVGEDDGLKIGMWEDEYFFQVIPRPVELMDLEAQKAAIKDSLSNIIKNAGTGQAKLATDLEVQNIKQQANIEANEIKDKAEQEAIILKLNMQKEIQDMREKAFADINSLRAKAEQDQAFLRQSVAEQDKIIRVRMEEERQKMLIQVGAEAATLLQKAKEESEGIKGAAHSMANDLKNQAHAYSDEIKNQAADRAKEEAEKVKKSVLDPIEQEKFALELKIKEIERAAETRALELKYEAEKQAEQAFQEGLKKIQALQDEAQSKANTLTQEAQLKSMDIIKQAEFKSEELVRGARKEAQDLTKSAHEESQSIREQANKKSNELIEEARRQSELMLSQVNQEVDDRIQLLTKDHLEWVNTEKKLNEKNLETHRTEALKQIKENLRIEKGTLLEDYEKKIAWATDNFTSLEAKIHKTSSDLVDLDQKKIQLIVDVTAFEAKADDLLSQIKQLNDDVTKAHETIKQGTLAQVDLEKTLESKAKAYTEYQKYEATLSDGKNKIQKEFKDLREKLLLEHDNDKKKTAEELARQRVKALEDLKNEIEQEEQRVVDVRKQQAAELANNVLLKLATLESHTKDKEAHSLATKEIFETVKAVLLNDETLLKPITAHLDEVKVKKEAERKKKIKPAIVASFAVASLTVWFFKDSIYSYMKSKEGNNIAAQMVEKRKIQSVYNPPKTNEFRGNYTDNVLYMNSYLEIKKDQTYQERWTLRMNDLELVRELGITEDDIIKFLSVESALVLRLEEAKGHIDALYLKEGLEKMRKIESEDMEKIILALKSEENYSKIRKLEKEFLLDFKKANFSK